MILLSLLFITEIVFGANLYDSCKFNLTDNRGVSAEYDLSYFNLDYEAFTVNDNVNNFKYAFNLCGNIPIDVFTANTSEIPSTCIETGDSHGPCIQFHTSESDEVTCVQQEDVTGESASAVQVNTVNRNCVWLGMEVKSTDKMDEYAVELYDQGNAGRGVVYTVLNGEWCPAAGKNRELRVTLICPDSNRIEFDPSEGQNRIGNEEVFESPMCTYNLEVESPLACPNRCISRLNIDMYAVCGANGICEADHELGTVRCLCDKGFTGTFCEEILNEIVIMEETHPGLLAAIVICIILLGIAIVLSAVLCHQIRIKEAEESSGTMHIGLTSDDAEVQNNLNKTKQNAVSMDMTSIQQHQPPQEKQSVTLQTMDDQLENDADEHEPGNQIEEEEEVEEQTNNNVLLDDADDGGAAPDDGNL